jgi:hypothetical protein
MTSSNTLKKIISIGAAMLLAVGGSLSSATPASAAAATTAPVVSSPALVGNTVSATPAVWPSGTATGKWYVCDSFGSAAAATSVPSGCDALYTDRLDTTPFTTSTLTIPSISYCANICTPFGNSSTAFKVRWIEVNGSDISASAAVAIQDGRTLSLQNPTVGATSVTLGVSNGCSFASSSLSSFADFTLLVAGSARTISSVSTASSNVVLNFSGALTSGQSISVSYTQSADPVITCGSSAFIRNTTTALSGTVGSGGGGGGGGGSTPCAGQTVVTSYAVSSPTLAPGGTYTNIYNGNPAFNNCLLQTTGFASARFLNGTLVGQFYYSGTSQGLFISNLTSTYAQLQNWAGRTLVNGDVITSKIWVSPGMTQPSASSSGDFSYTITITGADGSASAAPALTPLQARNALKPVPAAVQPLVPAFLALNKPMASLGGKVALSAGDFTGLVAAKIANKSIDFILGKTGQITMTVPQGEAGKTADLVLTFNTGSIILQDAIKYVAPVVVAAVPARPVSVSSASKSFSEEAQTEIRQAAFANVKNTAVACVGYAAANTASAREAAVALATKACAIANKANSDLAITGVEVIVDKLKARTQGVGIKVYKADN